MSSSYNTPCMKRKLVVSIYSNTELSLAMSTLAVWSRDVRSRVFSRSLFRSLLSGTNYHVMSHLQRPCEFSGSRLENLLFSHSLIAVANRLLT